MFLFGDMRKLLLPNPPCRPMRACVFQSPTFLRYIPSPSYGPTSLYFNVFAKACLHFLHCAVFGWVIGCPFLLADAPFLLSEPSVAEQR